MAYKRKDAPKNNGGRPRKLIPGEMLAKELRKLGALFCTQKEVAAHLDVSVGTIENLFRDNPDMRQAFENGMETGRTSLRRMQFKMASRSAAMLIWMGKQHLGQKEVLNQRVFLKPIRELTEAECDELLSGLEPAELEAVMAESGYSPARNSPN